MNEWIQSSASNEARLKVVKRAMLVSAASQAAMYFGAGLFTERHDFLAAGSLLAAGAMTSFVTLRFAMAASEISQRNVVSSRPAEIFSAPTASKNEI